jgi:hypothetical protein
VTAELLQHCIHKGHWFVSGVSVNPLNKGDDDDDDDN